ncbi:sensor histidine kinase [Robertkochia sediminum]|uniref:sensor histidine kinase n=1 Tax=Robertkochia sediminum TaxID=2785326 RepID=UPI0019335131|nr:HAMP domain-containing sensor histidine kinase [Robertkochia sediminum]MBL7472357.1 HAMP domain-containing histidine kinase [Robertkochia sediminum]
MNKTTRWILIISSFAIVVSILFNTYIFFQRFKEEERTKMNIWARAQAEFLQTEDLDRDLGDLTLEVLRNNRSTPMIYVGRSGELRLNNISEKRAKDSTYLYQKIDQFAQENAPIEVCYKKECYGTLYYGNSEVINNLKYYPVALILIIVLFAAVVYFFYRTTRISDQNKLWAGMAKETAHQIGTPISSLLGWNEILKDEDGINPEITTEIEKDITRLQTITERFSKIGSIPSLERLNLVDETRTTLEYLQVRTSKQVHFSFESEAPVIYCMINAQLYSWTIENLVKNAIDAMKGKGSLKVRIDTDGKTARILVTDTGKGIPKNDYNRIFEPGFTTKKRGWGLGLSLVKRIIEDYHDGKVKVLHSATDKGTTMQIILKTA